WPLIGAQAVQTAQQTHFPSRGGFRSKREDVQAVFREFHGNFGNTPGRIDTLEFLARESLTVDDLLVNVDIRGETENAQMLLGEIANDNPVRLVNLAQVTMAG